MRIKIVILAAMLVAMLASCGSGSEQAKMSPEQELSAIVMQQQANLPTQVAENMVWKDITVEGENIIYIYEVDDPTGTQVATFANKHDDILAGLSNSLAEKDFRDFAQLAVDLNKNLKYRYKEKTSALTTEVTITTPELKQLLASK